MARMVEKGCDCPCLERGSRTFLRHRTKWERDAIVNILTSVSRKKEAKPFRSSLYYVKNREMLAKKRNKNKKFTKYLLADSRLPRGSIRLDFSEEPARMNKAVGEQTDTLEKWTF